MRRKAMGRKASKKSFRKGNKVKGKNLRLIRRGGMRL